MDSGSRTTSWRTRNGPGWFRSLGGASTSLTVAGCAGRMYAGSSGTCWIAAAESSSLRPTSRPCTRNASNTTGSSSAAGRSTRTPGLSLGGCRTRTRCSSRRSRTRQVWGSARAASTVTISPSMRTVSGFPSAARWTTTSRTPASASRRRCSSVRSIRMARRARLFEATACSPAMPSTWSRRTAPPRRPPRFSPPTRRISPSPTRIGTRPG